MTFWTAFKRLVHNKKLTNIPPILEEGKNISDFHLKSNICNDYFVKQCTLNKISNSLSPLRMSTMSRRHSVDTFGGKIVNIILKTAVSKPLNLSFKKCLTEGVFPKASQVANVQAIHKKKQ